jgi:predicted phage replisome organizer
MAEVKWIKLSTDLFDNRKIRQIEVMPDGYAIIVAWVKILCLAGNVNDSGLIYFTKEIPYTEQMLAAQFNMPLTTVQLALRTFQQFNMVDIVDNMLHVSNWEKYQNVGRLAEIREYNRLAQQKSRANRKLLSNVNDMSMTCQRCHETDIDIDLDIKNKNLDIDLDTKNKKEKEKESLKPSRHKYGEYKNVLLTDKEYEQLQNEYPDTYSQWIEQLSEYMASTGKSYKSHFVTIRRWVKRREEEKARAPTQRQGYKTSAQEAIEVDRRSMAAWAERE